jgi:hypothetical protein
VRKARAARRATLSLLALATIAPAASAAPAVKLTIALTPEKLGAGTTISFAFKVPSSPDTLPPPLSSVSLFYPAHINLADSELGLANCTSQRLQLLGPPGCPADALMGYGTARVEIPIGKEIIQESAEITIWMGPLQDGKLQLLFSAEGHTPVSDETILPSLIVEAPPPYGGQLTTTIPPLETFPEAASPSVVEMHATIGPKTIVYYLHSHGKTLAYHPTGLLLPEHCPKHGFPFAATFTFQDGSHTRTQHAVPCPPPR